jgi:chloramphenicol-sensitive protein RarD
MLAWWTFQHDGALLRGDSALNTWLLLSGPLTALPLLLFAAGARRLPLSTLGVLQYMSPTIQFGIGVWVFGEPFDAARLAGFALIWTALLLYTLDAAGVRRAPLAAPEPPH